MEQGDVMKAALMRNGAVILCIKSKTINMLTRLRLPFFAMMYSNLVSPA